MSCETFPCLKGKRTNVALKIALHSMNPHMGGQCRPGVGAFTTLVAAKFFFQMGHIVLIQMMLTFEFFVADFTFNLLHISVFDCFVLCYSYPGISGKITHFTGVYFEVLMHLFHVGFKSSVGFERGGALAA